jgi:hypothetical protein
VCDKCALGDKPSAGIGVEATTIAMPGAEEPMVTVVLVQPGFLR